MRLPLEGKEMTVDQVLNLLTNRDGAKRKAAAKAIGAGLGAHAATSALITNTLAKDKEIEDRWRGFARPVSSRNLANQVEDEVVDALVSAVTAAYPRLAHRYYKIKAGWFGADHLDYWDRNAPLAGGFRPQDSLGGGQGDRARRLCRLLAGAGRRRQALLRPGLDRCPGASGQGARAPSPIPSRRAPIPISC